MPAAARKAIFTVRLGLLSLFGGALMTASGGVLWGVSGVRLLLLSSKIRCGVRLVLVSLIMKGFNWNILESSAEQ